MATLKELEQAYQNPNVRKFLDFISWSEGTEKHGYHTNYGGSYNEDLSKHPNKVLGRTSDGATTATGRYQFTGTTWKGLEKKYGFKDFGAYNQDLGAIALIAERGALQDVMNGDMKKATQKLNRTWTSFTGFKGGTKPHSMQAMEKAWAKLGDDNYSPTNYKAEKPTNQPTVMPEIANTFTQDTTNAFSIPNQPQQNIIQAQELMPWTNEIISTAQPLPEPQYQAPPKPDYSEGLASAFGVIPDGANQGLGEYVSSLVESIYNGVE